MPTDLSASHGRDGVRFPFWSIAYVEVRDHEAGALAAKYDEFTDSYIVSHLTWQTDLEDNPVIGSLEEHLLEYAATKEEKAEVPLPVVSKSGNGCSRELRRLRFPDPLGEKKV